MHTLSSAILFLDLDLVGGAGDVFLSPLDDDDVVSPVPDDVPAFVVILAFVLQLDLITRTFGAIDAYIKDVGA